MSLEPSAKNRYADGEDGSEFFGHDQGHQQIAQQSDGDNSNKYVFHGLELSACVGVRDANCERNEDSRDKDEVHSSILSRDAAKHGGAFPLGQHGIDDVAKIISQYRLANEAGGAEVHEFGGKTAAPVG